MTLVTWRKSDLLETAEWFGDSTSGDKLSISTCVHDDFDFQEGKSMVTRGARLMGYLAVFADRKDWNTVAWDEVKLDGTLTVEDAKARVYANLKKHAEWLFEARLK